MTDPSCDFLIVINALLAYFASVTFIHRLVIYQIMKFELNGCRNRNI